MKPLTIKGNVTVWYTSLLVIVLSVVLAGILYASDLYMVSKAKSELVEVVISNADDIGIQNGSYDLSDLERFDGGANIIVHQVDGALLFGKYPSGFPENLGWTKAGVQLATAGDRQWLYYDHILPVSDQEQIVVRGIRSVDEVVGAISTASLAALSLFPILILFAAWGGYRITGRALRPVKQITDLAAEISGGGDLTRRIGATEFTGSGDEIQVLADTFDSMFERLQASFERERQFASDASHELRTPTAIIMAHAESALSQEATPADREEALRIILGQAGKMSDLISQLLMIARNENPGEHLNLEQFDFSELAELVGAEMAGSAAKSDIRVVTEIEPRLMVHADHLMLTRLLVNLLSNSIKYGKEGGTVFLRVRRDQKRILGQIADDGIGIEAESLDKVWERFYRARPGARDNPDSTGLGLPIARWIVEIHGGTISLESVAGEGTVVTFCLPLGEE